MQRDPCLASRMNEPSSQIDAATVTPRRFTHFLVPGAAVILGLATLGLASSLLLAQGPDKTDHADSEPFWTYAISARGIRLEWVHVTPPERVAPLASATPPVFTASVCASCSPGNICYLAHGQRFGLE